MQTRLDYFDLSNCTKNIIPLLILLIKLLQIELSAYFHSRKQHSNAMTKISHKQRLPRKIKNTRVGDNVNHGCDPIDALR